MTKKMHLQLWQSLGKCIYFVTKPLIKFILSFTPERTRVIVLCDTEILLLKDWIGTGEWKLPGGGLFKDELPKQGAIRELYEETGIRIERSRLSEYKKFDAKKYKLGSTMLAYKVDFTKKPKLRRSFEISESKWFNVNQLSVQNLSATTKIILTEYYPKLKI